MKEFKNLYLVAILTLVLTITGCGQASDGGGIDSMSSTEQRKNREDTGQDETPEDGDTQEESIEDLSGFLLTHGGSYYGSLDCTMQGRVQSGAIEKGDKAILLKSDGTHYETRIEKIALEDDLDQSIPAVKVKEGSFAYVWLEGLKPADIQFYDILLGETEWERGIPMEFPFDESEEYSLTLAPQEDVERQAELRVYDRTGKVVQRIPYGTFTEPVYNVLRENGHRNLAIFPEKEDKKGRLLEWNDGQFSELDTDIKKGETRNVYDLLVTQEGEKDITKRIYRPFREGVEAEKVRGYHLQRDTGELEIWDELDDKILFQGIVSLHEDGMPVNDDYYDMLFTEDLYRWAWDDEERDESISVDRFSLGEEDYINFIGEAEFESREAFLEAYGLDDSTPIYQYYDRLGNLRLELYKKEKEDLFCVISYGYSYDSKREKRTGFSGYVLEGVSEKEWVDDTYSVMDIDSKEWIDDYEESLEYTSDQKPKHFYASGLDRNTSEDRETFDMFQIDYVYRDDGSLYYRYNWHNATQFETYRCVERSYYDEKERLIYETAYITHGELEDFYIYPDEGDIPEYRLEIDHGGGRTYIERYDRR